MYFGYLAGFLGIALGLFLHFLLLNNLTSFGVPYFTPFFPISELLKNNRLYLKPIWKRENRDNYLNTQKPQIEEPISMKWRDYEK